MSDTDRPTDAEAAEQPGLLDRLGEVFHHSGEGDLPRPVDTSTPPVETHNRTALDEPYPATEMAAGPRAPGYGATDQDQIPELTHAEAPGPPLGPDPVSGGMITAVPTPRVPHGELSPTDEPSGMFGGADTGGQKMRDEERET